MSWKFLFLSLYHDKSRIMFLNVEQFGFRSCIHVLKRFAFTNVFHIDVERFFNVSLLLGVVHIRTYP